MPLNYAILLWHVGSCGVVPDAIFLVEFTKLCRVELAASIRSEHESSLHPRLFFMSTFTFLKKHLISSIHMYLE